jgi:hypothetical protein
MKLYFWFIFITVYVVYYYTLFPSIPGGDAGEIAAEACQLGTAHPPGYPLFTMMNNIASKIPFPRILGTDLTVDVLESDPAWRMNHLSGLLGAFAAALVGSTGAEIIDVLHFKVHHSSLLSACAGGFLYGFSPLVWEYSLGTEVFALNNFFCALLCYLVARVYVFYECARRTDADEDKRALQCWSYVGALVCGLTLTNQHASLLLVIPSIGFVFLLLVDALAISILVILKLGTAFLVGILPYIYLIFASSHPTKGSWGDLTSIEGFFRHVLRQEYGTFRLGALKGESTHDGLERIGLYLRHVSGEWPCLLLLAAAGIVALIFWIPTGLPGKFRYTPLSWLLSRRHGRNLGCFLIGAWCFYVGIWHFVLSNLPLHSPTPYGVHARFWMQPTAILCILSAVGVSYIYDFVIALIGLKDNMTHNLLRGTSSSSKSNSTTAAVNAMKKNKNKKYMDNTTVTISSSSIKYSDSAVVTAPAHISTVSKFHIISQIVLVITILATVLPPRFVEMDKSNAGSVLHRYGKAVLKSVPQNSIILSHTDLDWNPVRYLQHCAGKRLDVSHISLQLMPYPWFMKQQASLYPNVNFVEPFPGIATDRMSEGNAHQIMLFIRNNIEYVMANENSVLSKGIFLDMQSLNESQIGDGNQWRGYTLLPWGTHYRVLQGRRPEETVILHKGAVNAMQRFEASLPKFNEAFYHTFHPFSWEFGASALVNDAKYQLGVFLLTYVIDRMQDPKIEMMPTVVDRLLLACGLLESVSEAALSTEAVTRRHKYFMPGPVGRERGRGSEALTVSIRDVHKNHAVAWMRVHPILTVCMKFKADFLTAANEPTFHPGGLISPKDVISIVEPEIAMSLLERGSVALSQFIRNYPEDPNLESFNRVRVMMQKEMTSISYPQSQDTSTKPQMRAEPKMTEEEDAQKILKSSDAKPKVKKTKKKK